MGKGRIKNMSRQNPCPICGKPDYCFWLEMEHSPGMYNLYCRRSSETDFSIITGNDGKEYISLPKKDKTVIGTRYESVEQREARKNQKVNGEKKEYVPKQMTVMDAVSPLPNDRLDEIYRCMLEMLPLNRYHAEYLLKEGWDMELIKKNHICSFPAKNPRNMPMSFRRGMTREMLASKVMRELGLKNLAGVPGAYIGKSGSWTFTGQSGILFPVYDENGYIYRLRIRLDYLDLPVKMKEDESGFYYMDGEERVTVTMSGAFVVNDGERVFKRFSTHEGKYRNFSSYRVDEAAYEAGFIENVYNKGCEAGNQLFYAANAETDWSVFWITEGEKKAIFTNHVIGQPVIALPGVNDFGRFVKSINGKTPLQVLKQRGAKTAIVAFDADRYKNDMVMRCMNALIELLKENGFIVYCADWNQGDGKGLDDLISSGHLPAFYLCE